MKINKIGILMGTAILIAIAGVITAFGDRKQANADSNKGFAVVELFTSEGCSSCPPADAAVAEIQREYKNQPVYILVFHVDYWNRLGWKDVFSKHEYSERQQVYARLLKLSSVYTPQIVVNGKKEFVGSEKGTLQSAIQSALKNHPQAKLTIGDVKIIQNKATLNYLAEGAGDNTSLLLALVERSAQTQVKAGENGGRTLMHVQIVHQLQSKAINNAKTGTETIALPKEFNAQTWELIALLQNTLTGEIIGAAKSKLPVAI